MINEQQGQPPDREQQGIAAAGADAISRLLDRPLSPEDLRHQTERVAKPVDESRERGVSALLFALGEENLAISTPHVVQVTHCIQPHRIPHRTNEVVLGLGNIHGELVLCVSLGRLLGIAATGDGSDDGDDSEHERMIVMGPPNDRWAFPVDRVHGVVRVATEDLKSPPTTVERALIRFTESLFRDNDRNAALLDAGRVVAGFRAALT